MILIKFMVGTFVVYCGVLICKWLTNDGSFCGVLKICAMRWNEICGDIEVGRQVQKDRSDFIGIPFKSSPI
jgi:hypothetical protein